MKRASGQWLESAEMDLGSIEQIIEREDLTPVTAFHSQQCVEKCLKAVLEEYAQKVPREHSTLKLYGLVQELIPLVEAETENSAFVRTDLVIVQRAWAVGCARRIRSSMEKLAVELFSGVNRNSVGHLLGYLNGLPGGDCDPLLLICEKEMG
jgi:HEPN domain-containing protein